MLAADRIIVNTAVAGPGDKNERYPKWLSHSFPYRSCNLSIPPAKKFVYCTFFPECTTTYKN
jgi:hypothetical protein